MKQETPDTKKRPSRLWLAATGGLAAAVLLFALASWQVECGGGKVWQAVRAFAEAQFNLGYMYQNGKGVAQNDAEAVSWYRKAAEQGLAAAQLDLGHHYFKGKGVSKDYAEGVRWTRKAAEQGDSDACYGLSICYAKGVGVAKDKEKDLLWLVLSL